MKLAPTDKLTTLKKYSAQEIGLLDDFSKILCPFVTQKFADLSESNNPIHIGKNTAQIIAIETYNLAAAMIEERKNRCAQ